MKILEHNATTNEVIERDATDDEIEQSKIDAEKSVERSKVISQKEKNKALILDKLGITAEEAALLLQ